MSGFQINQGNSASSSTPGGSIFGNPSTSGTVGGTGTSTGVLGSNPANGSGTNFSTDGSAFGNAGTGKSIFGNNNVTTTAGTSNHFGVSSKNTLNTGGGIFGGGSSTGGGAFGSSSSGTAGFTNSSSGAFGGVLGSSSSAKTSPTTGAFGTSASLFGASKPAEQSNTTSKPASSSFFSVPPASSSSSGGGGGGGSGSTNEASGGLLGAFGKPVESSSTSTSNTTTSAAGTGGLLGGGLFGKKADDSTPKLFGTSITSTTPSFFLLGSKDAGASKDAAPAGSLFGTTNAKSDSSAEKKDAPASTSLGLFSLGAKDTSTERKDVPAVPSLFGNTPSLLADDKKDKQSELEKPKDLTACASTSIAVTPPSMLRGKTIEEIVNKWSSDLDTHVREFNKFAREVAVWDRALIQNGNSLAALYSHVLAAEREQNDIEQSLDHIEHQQKDLSATLDAYEKTSEEILGGQGGNLRALDTGPADTERDKNYMLAAELHAQLDDLSGSLTQMIEAVNAVSTPNGSAVANPSQGGEDPMSQIAQILSTHLESLQWIDGAVREVEGAVMEVEKGIQEAGLMNSGFGNGLTKSRSFGLAR